MNRGAWWATVHGITEPDMTEVTWHIFCAQTWAWDVDFPGAPGSCLHPGGARGTLGLAVLMKMGKWKLEWGPASGSGALLGTGAWALCGSSHGVKQQLQTRPARA